MQARTPHTPHHVTSIHIDDCWMSTSPPRDASGSLAPNASRFPSGMAALGDYMHSRNVSFGLYTAESPSTCAGYPASLNHEQHDALTFAAWVRPSARADAMRTDIRFMFRAWIISKSTDAAMLHSPYRTHSSRNTLVKVPVQVRRRLCPHGCSSAVQRPRHCVLM